VPHRLDASTPAATTARRAGFTPGCAVSDTSCHLVMFAHLEVMDERCAVVTSPCLVSTSWGNTRSVATVWIPSSPAAPGRAASRSSARTEGREATPEVPSAVRHPFTHVAVCSGCDHATHLPAGVRLGPRALVVPVGALVQRGSSTSSTRDWWPLTDGALHLGSARPPDGPQTFGFPVSDRLQCLLRFLRS
jgi:hypothetical protein